MLIFELLGAFLMVIDHHTLIQNIYGREILELAMILLQGVAEFLKV